MKRKDRRRLEARRRRQARRDEVLESMTTMKLFDALNTPWAVLVAGVVMSTLLLLAWLAGPL